MISTFVNQCVLLGLGATHELRRGSRFRVVPDMHVPMQRDLDEPFVRGRDKRPGAFGRQRGAAVADHPEGNDGKRR
jgi:hypothetical protein